MSDLLEQLEREEWGRHAQPGWNAPGEVPAAIRALADPTDLDRTTAYHRLLYAMGNNHAGTYYPVVVPVIPFLGQILRGSALIARLRALDVLIDLLASFAPELGYEVVVSATVRRSLASELRKAAVRLTEDVERLQRHPGSDEEESLARELLELLRE